MKRHSDNQSLLPALIRIAVALGILLVTLAALMLRGKDAPKEAYDEVVTPPGCLAGGYTVYTHRETGEVIVSDQIAPLGHDYGKWETIQESDGLSCTVFRHSCDRCGSEETRAEYPKLAIPLLALEGDMARIGKYDTVNLTAVYSGGAGVEAFEAFAGLKYQGHSSLAYDKKNYTVKFFSDEGHDEKLKTSFLHWNKEHKYILKANYLDETQCRNLVSADVWADITATRDNLPAELKQLSHYGAVDGFPVALYINREFHGLYTWNLHKDDDLFGMDEGKQQAIVICNEASRPEAFFRSEAAFEEDSPWELEFCGTGDNTWARDSFNALVRFTMTADDMRFRNELKEYLDVDAAIDYLLAVYALGIPANETKDLVLVSYGDRWIPSMYDMDCAFGLAADGEYALVPEEGLPHKTEKGFETVTGNLLFERLLENFLPEISARYAMLRKDILAPENLVKRVDAFVESIPDELYAVEERVNPKPSANFDGETQIRAYIAPRMAAMDSLFLGEDKTA